MRRRAMVILIVVNEEVDRIDEEQKGVLGDFELVERYCLDRLGIAPGQE